MTTFDNSNRFIITKPRELTNASLVASNVPEDDYAEYDPLKTYAAGERCITAATHDIWQSVDAGNVGNSPASNPDKWRSPGKTNRWRAFDPIVASQTTQEDLITYEIKPGGAVTNLNVLNLSDALSVQLVMVDPYFGEVYNETRILASPPDTPSWWVWTFGGRIVSTFAAFNELPAYPNAQLNISIVGGENLAVGTIMFGQGRSFGLYGAQPGARVGMLSHSVRERDEFGTLQLVRRLPSKRMNFSLLIPNSEVDALNRYLMEIDAVPCFFSASREFDTMNVYGILGNFDTVITYPNHALCDIEIEGFQ